MSEHRTHRLSGRITIALLVAIVLCVGYTGWQVHNLLVEKNSAQHTASQATDNTQKLAAQIQQACKQGDVKINGRDLCQKAKKVAKHPTEPVAGPQGEQGVPGDRGPAPTESQIMIAVTAYCQHGKCQGEQGVQGKPGANPSQQDIEDAVAAYCNANGECQGPAGDDGKQGETGKDGEDSTVPGPKGDTGPGPTQEQINAAVSSYCGSHSCTGPKGETGAKGDPGKDGVSIAKVECDSSGSWVVTLSDGTVQHPSGTCRIQKSSDGATAPATQPAS